MHSGKCAQSYSEQDTHAHTHTHTHTQIHTHRVAVLSVYVGVTGGFSHMTCKTGAARRQN